MVASARFIRSESVASPLDIWRVGHMCVSREAWDISLCSSVLFTDKIVFPLGWSRICKSRDVRCQHFGIPEDVYQNCRVPFDPTSSLSSHSVMSH